MLSASSLQPHPVKFRVLVLQLASLRHHQHFPQSMSDYSHESIQKKGGRLLIAKVRRQHILLPRVTLLS